MYIRKTYDEYQIFSNCGYGWNYETSEETYKALKEQLKCYRDNCPNMAFKWKKVRVKIEGINK